MRPVRAWASAISRSCARPRASCGSCAPPTRPPASGAPLLGAIVVLLADMLVRQLPPERELKLGVLTALVGAPFFVWLVWKERQRWL